MALHADLRNVSQARQRLLVSADWTDRQLISSANIRGLAVTPGGRLLVAHSVSSIPPYRWGQARQMERRLFLDTGILVMTLSSALAFLVL